MNIFQFNGLILLLNLLLTVVGIFLWLYFIRKLQDVKHKEQEIDSGFNKFLEHAHTKAEIILEEATRRASEILTETQTLKTGIEEQINQSVQMSLSNHVTMFNDVSQKTTESYAELLKTLRQEFLGDMSKLSDKVKELAEENLNVYKQIIKDEASTAQLSIQEKIDQEFAKAKKDIDAYRKSEISYIDKSIGKIILLISKDIISREITVSDKQNLLLEALERAKKEGLFNS